MTILLKIIRRLTREFERRYINQCICYKNHSDVYTGLVQFNHADSLEMIKGTLSDHELECVWKKRFLNGSRLWYMEEDGKIIAYGWQSQKVKDFYVWEIAADLQTDKDIYVLYDFRVEETFRNQGIYQNLLRYICNENDDSTPILIYALSDNYASLRGIEKAGFLKTGFINHRKNHISI